MKLQISLEFMIMLSFVLLVFILLLYIISNQRTSGLESQSFSQLQLIAQSIALQLYKAETGGNGYSTQISVYGTVLTSNTFNITITNAGSVILQEHVGGQRVQAIAYSSVKRIASNPSFLAPGSSASYIIPVYNGSISVQNSFGTLCLDYQCPTSSGTPGQISLSSQNVYAATFSGQSSTNYVSIPSLTALNGQGSYSISAWIKYNGGTQYLGQLPLPIGWPGCHMGFFFQNFPHVYLGFIEWYSTTSNPPPGCPGGTTGNLQVYAAVQPNTWYFVTATVNHNSGAVSFYLNGVLAMTGNVPSGSYLANFAETGYFGDHLDENTNTNFFNGSIANIQIYNASLSANQIISLYNQGIASSPLPSNVVGWWPLNGNTNDYSGNGNKGTANGFILFPSVSEIFGQVLNTNGQALDNLLVGFTTTLGNLTNFGRGFSSFNYTNSNGIAVAFLNSNFTNGFANVRATVFNGNTSYQGNLIGWWPLNSGQGNVIPDISPSQNSGASTNGVYWNSPNYVANFNGVNGNITTSTSTMLSGASAMTISVWFKTPNLNFGGYGGGAHGLVDEEGSFGLKLTPQNNPQTFSLCVNGVAWCFVPGFSGNFLTNAWYNLVVTWSSGGPAYYYVNGVLVGNSIAYSGTETPASPCPLMIGTANSCSPNINDFYGSISNVQIYSAALSSTQAAQIYGDGINGAPISSNLVAWYPLNGNANDYSSNGNTGSVSGGVQFVSGQFPQIPLINQSSVSTASFNGVNSYIQLPNSPSLQSSTLTITGWINLSGPPTGYFSLLMAKDSAWAFGVCGTSFIVCFYNFPTSTEYDSKALLSAKTWYFLSATMSGGTENISINGQKVLSDPFSVNSQAYAAQIGADTNGGAYINGSVSNVQIYNTTLSQQQLGTLYAEGMEAPPININNLIGWYMLNGNANDSSLKNNNGAATAVTYTSQKDFIPSGTSSLGSYGMNFNGANGYIIVNTLTAQNFYLYINPGAIGTGTVSTYISSWVSSTSNIIPNTWQYVGFTNNPTSNTLTLYIDGDPAGSFAAQGTNAESAFVWIYPVNVISYQSLISKNDNIPTQLDFGVRNAGLNAWFDGSMANIQVYNNALSAAQVSQLYNINMPVTSSINVPVGWSP